MPVLAMSSEPARAAPPAAPQSVPTERWKDRRSRSTGKERENSSYHWDSEIFHFARCSDFPSGHQTAASAAYFVRLASSLHSGFCLTMQYLSQSHEKCNAHQGALTPGVLHLLLCVLSYWPIWCFLSLVDAKKVIFVSACMSHRPCIVSGAFHPRQTYLSENDCHVVATYYCKRIFLLK